MTNLEKFKNENLELNNALKIQGGIILGGRSLNVRHLEETAGCTDTELSRNPDDVKFHHYDDAGKYLGYTGGKI